MLFVVHVLSVTKLGDVLLFLSLSVMRCISAELLDVYQTAGVCIGKWFPVKATTDNTAAFIAFTKIDSSYEI